MSSGARVSIPNSVRTTVQNIKEIIANHSEEEIYAMLKECSMDPNETTQKLLFQDPFHEVKRKRDRRKENLSKKESVKSRWKSGMQGRGSRAGRGNYVARFSANDASGGRNTIPVKENGINQASEKGVGLSSLPISQEAKNKEITPATSSLVTNGPTAMTAGSTGDVHAVDLSWENLANKSEQSSAVDISKLGGPPPLPHLANAKKNPGIEFGTGSKNEKLPSSSSNDSTTGTQPSPGIYFLDSDPVLVPSNDSLLPGVMGAIKREVGRQRTPAEQISLTHSEGKSTAAASEVGSSSVQGQMPSKSREVGNNQLSEYTQPASSSHGGASVIRPLSNYNSRLQQAIGPQKVGPTKEWKPKPTNLNLVQGPGTAGTSEVPTTAKANEQTCPVSSVLDSKEDTSKLQRNLEELHISDGQHVIIPNHLHVPEAEKVGFCFGSFDASFDLSTGYNSAHENDIIRTPLSETSESVEESAEEPSSQNALSTTEGGDYPDDSPSPRYVPENLSSGEGDVSSNMVPEHCEPKQESAMPPGSHQFSVAHTSPSYNFGFMLPTVGSQLAQSESSESQTRDVSRLPSFVVRQPIDPGSYYAHFYRPTTDSDGRISPFHSPGATTKYNGNLALLSLQTSQSAQEGGNSVLLSTAGPTPLVTQAAGLMQSSIPVTQQPIPVFRQPTAMTVPHYSPNYIPYGHYFSPLYAPHPALHQFLSHGAFPQLPQAGNIYPAPPGTIAKYPVTQFKVGTNTGNSTHVGVVGNYVPYGSSPASYSPSSASTAGNSTANEDLNVPQFKESNVYVTGQQTEGSAVWIAAPGRDIPGLQTSSFYNLPAQGQLTFTPTQASHGTFTGMYHPAHAISAATVHPLLQQSQTLAAAVDVAGPAANVYQQPQHSQINWPNNY